MTIVVTVGKRKVANVHVRVSNTGQIVAGNPVTISSLPIPPTRRLDALSDVDASTEVEGGVPVYHVQGDKYVVEALNLSSDITEIDGGSF